MSASNDFSLRAFLCPADFSSDSGIDQIQQLSVLIDQTMTLLGDSCPLLSGPVSTAFMMLSLVVMPEAKLILPLNVDAGHIDC